MTAKPICQVNPAGGEKPPVPHIGSKAKREETQDPEVPGTGLRAHPSTVALATQTRTIVWLFVYNQSEYSTIQ